MAPPRPRPPAPRRESEHSALTAMPSAAMAVVRTGEQPTAALPSVADALPDLLHDPTTTNEPTGQRPAPPPARSRQDTPTEMFVQEVHGAAPDAGAAAAAPIAGAPGAPGQPAAEPAPAEPAGAASPDDDDDDDGGRTRVAHDVAGSPDRGAAPPSSGPVARPQKPDLGPLPGSDDDNPTSVLDLDALHEAVRRKAAGPPLTTPPPALGAPAIGLPELGPPARDHGLGGTGALGAPGGGAPGGGPQGVASLPAGASDTMRLDVESLSGPLPLARLAADAESAGESFDPSRISLGDAQRPAAPKLIDGLDTAVHSRAGLSAMGVPPAPPPQAGSGPSAGKPAWQVNVDQGIAAITASTREATARFLSWYRALRPNEQMAFVAGTVLGFAIVVMLFILWIR